MRVAIDTTLARHAPPHQEVTVQGLKRRWQQKAAFLGTGESLKKKWGKQIQKTMFSNFFFQTFANEGSSISLPAALKTLHCNLLVWGRMARQGGGDFSTASGQGSTIPQVVSLQWGSMLMLVRDLAP